MPRAQSFTEARLHEVLSDLGADWVELLKGVGVSLGIDPAQVGTLETADTIIGGRWPSQLLGSMRYPCEPCGAFVSLAPSSQRILAARPIRVVCMRCARKAVGDG